MPSRPQRYRPPGQPTSQDAERAYDRERSSSLPTRRLYATAAWRALRSEQLALEPLCRFHLGAGQVVAATICDHVEPHRGQVDRFWAGPFQSLCKACHDGAKQAGERSGGGSKV